MKSKWMLSLFVLLLLFGSCSDGDDTSRGEGTLNVLLTDAPFPYESVAEANVTVFKVEARRADAEGMEDADAASEGSGTDESMDGMGDPGDGSPFVVLMEEEVAVNLLDLTNGVTEQLASVDIPVGTYDLVRVYVKGVNVVLTDGRTFDLKIPSGAQSGIKVFIKPGIQVVGGLSADLLLDFDLSRSFVARGGTQLAEINGFNFKPVVKASNMSTAGTLKGQVFTTPAEGDPVGLEGVTVGIYQNEEMITSALTDADGNYMVMGLEAGEYSVLAEKEGYSPVEAGPFTIVAANRTEAPGIELIALEE